MTKTLTRIANLFLTIFFTFFILTGYTTLPQNTEEYFNNIEHICFNTLIAFPEKALSPTNNNHQFFDESKITPIEFKRILEQLYTNNYIVISINDLYKIENDTILLKTPTLPKNKKPILLSFDNISYISNYQNHGEIDKIILDRNNNIATYTTRKSIQDRIAYDNECIPILEEFINKHPDFTYNNARGIIFLTGYNGILGYNTNHRNSTSKHEIKRATEVVARLKTLGWTFGSNNYRYINYEDVSDIEFIKDLSLWNKEVRSIIDHTPLYAYAISPQNNIHPELLANNYKIFFTKSFDKRFEFHINYIIMPRKEINGKTLRTHKTELKALFDCESIYDHTNRYVDYNNLLQ